MSEWWTYRPSDFLMFSAESYRRLFELYNAAWWPLQALPLLAGAMIAGMLVRRGSAPRRTVAAVLALCWLWVAWAFHAQRFATINLAASGYAWAFALEGALIAIFGAWRTSVAIQFTPRANARVAMAMFVVALGYPVLGVAAGHSLREGEFFGFAPDPTTIGTLALLMLARQGSAWLLRVVPLAWCVAGGLTLWTLGDGRAWSLLGAAVVAVVFSLHPRRERGG